MAYGMPMTPEERMMQLIMQRRNNPYGTPTTMESQVAAGTAQLDPRALEAAGGMAIPASPDLSQNSMSAKQAALQQQARSTAGMESRLASQQAFADSLRGTPGAKLQRVGPSNIAVANPWDGLEVGFNRALGGYMSGKLRDDYAAVDEAKTDQAMGQAEYEDLLAQEERDAAAEQTALKLAVDRELAAARNATSTANNQRTVGATLAGQQAADARAQAAITARREEATEDENYTLDGRVVNIVKDATGKPFMGGLDGTPIDAETFSRAVEYRPGTDKGTLGDEASFQMPLVDEIAPAQSLFSGVFTSPYFNQATGVFDPERWAGTLGVGPDGTMVQATQSDMAASVMGPMAVRMEEINLRPWTEKEIATITADFPTPNSEYPDWARFGARVIIPKVEARFAEAIARGRTTPEMREKEIARMYSEVIGGWSQNAGNRSFKDLEQLGVPPARIRAYLREKERRGR